MDTSATNSAPESLIAAPSAEQYKLNIRCVLGVIFFQVASAAITLGAIFDAYLLNLGGQNGNALVGAVESTRGLLQLVLAYPIGLLSDRFSRVTIVQRSLPLWTLGIATVVCGVLFDNMCLIFLGIAFYAPCSQCWTSCAQVLVAESVDPSKRTKALANLTTTRLLSNSLGPLLQVGLFLILRRNHWYNSLLRWVITAGCLLWPGVVRWTCALEALPPLEKTTQGGRGAASLFGAEDLERPLHGMATRWWVAINLELVSFVVSIGAGMTVKFFPLFFRIDYQFSPVEVCLLSFVYPVSISAMVQLCQLIAKHLARLHVVLVFHLLSTCCLWAMVYCRPLLIVLPLYIMRGALMNARGPLVRAMIMDLVPTERRGRWTSIQSISSFTWSGSAALGGYIADISGDYRFTFAVTAVIYTSAFVLCIPLLLICPKEIRAQANPAAPGTASDAVSARSSERGMWLGADLPHPQEQGHGTSAAITSTEEHANQACSRSETTPAPPIK